MTPSEVEDLPIARFHVEIMQGRFIIPSEVLDPVQCDNAARWFAKVCQSQERFLFGCNAIQKAIVERVSFVRIIRAPE